MPAGSFGLSAFFFLSAYLIVTLLELERERTGTVQVKAFAMRRLLRIWPLYLLGLLLGLAWPFASGWGHIHGAALPAMLLMLGNVWVLMHAFSLWA